MMTLNEIAAEIMARMCEDARFGYSQGSRWGIYDETWTIDGRDYVIGVGDHDCSSGDTTAWRVAFQHTPYVGSLDGATFTGDMKAAFLSTGLFRWYGINEFSAQTGDLYLNEGCHTAMCIDGSPDNDILAEFSIAETGDIYGEQGDQTGWESHIQPYYSYPWDGILHWIGETVFDDEPQPEPTPKPKPKRVPARYLAMVDDEWLPLMRDKHDTGGSSDDYAGIIGRPIQYFGCNYHKYRVMTKESLEDYEAGRSKTKWLDWIYKFDLDDLVNGAAGDGSPILYLQVMSRQVAFEVHCTDGKWRKAKKTKTGLRAGDGKHAIDAVRMWRP